MSSRASGASRGIPRAWFLPLIGLVGLLSLAAAGILSRSIVLDLAAWWPVWSLIVLLSVAVIGRSIGRVRLSGVVPLLATVVLAAFTVGHLQGWPAMPSAFERLVGPEVGETTTAELEVLGPGGLRVRGGGAFLYMVEPVRLGGSVGLPDAVETRVDSTVSVVLSPRPEPGLYTFAGWNLTLSGEPSWDLELDGDVEADLSGLSIDGLSLSGSGSVLLGEAAREIPVEVLGDYLITLPSDAVVRIMGDATVPGSWERLEDGWRSPADGEGWVLSVSEGASLEVAEG